MKKIKDSTGLVPGIILIGIGFIGVLNIFNLTSELFILPTVAIAFLAIYVLLGGSKKYSNIGFLIPGLMVSAVSIYTFIEEFNILGNNPEIALFALVGTGFLLIYLLHTRKFKDSQSSQRWPLIVSGLLYAFTGFYYLVEYSNLWFVDMIGELLFPIIMISAGLYVIIKGMIKNKKE